MNSVTFAVRAAWIVPASRSPIPDGVVVVRDGIVQWVGPASRSPVAATDLGDVAIVPGLVNAHTHLEFSDLERPLGSGERSFADWIRAVVAYRNSTFDTETPERTRREVPRRGCDEMAATGTSVAGEIVTSPASATDYETTSETSQGDLRQHCIICPFYEVLGSGPESNVRWADAVRFVTQWNRHAERAGPAGRAPRAGLSPHAPYSVRPELFSAVIQFAVQEKLPLAMHLAETQEERELLQQGSGPLADLLRDLGSWDADALRQMSIERCITGIAQAPRSLLVHGNYLTPREMDLVAEYPHVSVVFCPRTHAYFGHDAYPLAALRKRNIRVCVGTDSRASNPDLSLWKELQCVAASFPELDANDILAMGTHLAAGALGIAGRYGSIQVGCVANLNIVRSKKESSAAIRHSIGWLFEPTTTCEPHATTTRDAG